MAKHAGGRPIEYDPKLHLDLANKYLSTRVDDEEGVTVVRQKLRNGKYRILTKKKPFAVKLPTIEGLALYMGIHKDTIYNWEGKYPEFSDVTGKLRAMQHDALITGGLSGKYNATITKLVLHKHGYRDSQELTGAEGKDLIPDNESKEKSKSAIATYLNKKKK